MTYLTSKTFWEKTAERAVKAFTYSTIGLLTSSATGLVDIDYGQVGSVAGLVGLLSVLGSVASGAIHPEDASPSLLEDKTVTVVVRPCDICPSGNCDWCPVE